MSPDRDLIWITIGAVVVFGALAVYSGRVLRFLGKTRGLKAPPPAAILVFRLWFTLLACGAVWLLLAGHPGLFGRPGTS